MLDGLADHIVSVVVGVAAEEILSDVVFSDQHQHPTQFFGHSSLGFRQPNFWNQLMISDVEFGLVYWLGDSVVD